MTYTNDNVPEAHLNLYFEALTRNFSEENLELVITGYKDGQPPADINIDFRAEYDGNRIIIGQYVFVTIRNSPMSTISPILEQIGGMGFTAPPDIEANLTTALYLYINGHCEPAELYTTSIQDKPLVDYYRASLLAFFKGECALQNNDFELAAEYFTEATSDNPDFSPYRQAAINLAWTYTQLDNYEQAFDVISDLVAMADEMAWSKVAILSKRAQLYALTARYDDAIADLNAAIKLDPDNPELYTLRGQMYLYLYEWDSVLDDYNHAIELDPTYADAYYFRGILYNSILQTGQELRPESLADFQHYLELAPNGDHAVDAARYVEQIQSELDALNG